MGTVVSGSLCLAGGSVEDIFFQAEGVAGDDEATASNGWKCTVLGNQVLVEWKDGVLASSDIDEVFRTSKHLVDNVALTLTIMYHVGFVVTLERARLEDGQVVSARPDQLPQSPGITTSINEVFGLIGLSPNLRWAIRDLNQGLIDRENSPVLFYRCIETLVRVVTEQSEVDKNAWAVFHSALGTSPVDIDPLLQKNRPHRHGSHEWFSGQEHLSMMQVVWMFVCKTIDYLTSHKASIAKSGGNDE